MQTLFMIAFLFVSASLFSEEKSAFDVASVKKEISTKLSKELIGSSCTQPILILIGGFPGSGKTTLIKALVQKYDIDVISWNAIRQSLLDRNLKGSPYDWEIIESVYQNLLKICLQHGASVVIDCNAYAKNIEQIERFVKTEQGEKEYRIVKICLNPPVETLFHRVKARQLDEKLHQGTEVDLQRDLNNIYKVMNLNDYSLVINTDEVSFETEIKIVDDFLIRYFVNENKESDRASQEDTMDLSEKEICFQEEHIPELAAAAGKQAYWQTLAAGHSVTVCRNGFMIEVFPDGSERVIRKTEPWVPVTKGRWVKKK
jgi:predicted kinase